MKVLISGGAGFIGSHLTELILAKGNEVTVIDNFSTGRHENIAHLSGNKKLTVVERDIATDPSGLETYLASTDWVFHLAALADIVPSINNPLDYHTANVTGTVNILEASRKTGVKRFIYAASSSCYGIPTDFPTNESARIDTRYPYALTKHLAEQYVLHWGGVYGLPVVSLRLFNVYGSRSRTSGAYGAVFGVFLAQKLAGKPFTVVGDGNQTRDFVFVKDAAEALYRAAASEVKQEIFNCGSGHTYSINRLVELLGGERVFIPKRPGEPECTHADIKKIEKVLGWQPQTSFEDGVRIMLDNIDYWKEAPVWTPQTIEKATGAWFRYLSTQNEGK